MEGEQGLKIAVQQEREALQAELEAMKAERQAFAEEMELLRQERLAFQAERARFQREKESLLAEKEAMRIASEIAKKAQGRTGRTTKKEKEKKEDFITVTDTSTNHCKPNRRKRPPQKLGPKTPPDPKAAGVPDDAEEVVEKKFGPKTRQKQKKVDYLDISISEEEDGEEKSKLKTRQKRKRVASSINFDKDEKCHPKVRRKIKTRVGLGTAEDSGDDGDVAFPAASEEEDLENLEVSFGQSLSATPAASPPPSPVVHSAGDCGGLVDVVSNGQHAQGETAALRIRLAKSRQPRSKTSHMCKDCGRSFRWTSHYLNHIKTHTGNKCHQCPQCAETFTAANQLVVHMRTHRTASTQHACNYCTLTFTSTTSLRKHIHVCHKKLSKTNREYKCTQCREVFTKASDLAVHMGVHSEGKPFKCSDCKSSFTSQGNLTVHMKKHRGEKPFRCTDCDATFPRSADLRSHARKHSSVKPYVCSICSAAFCRAGDLKPHMRTHTGEKPFQCEVCGAAFSTSSNLAVHRRTHTGERPFQCEQCGASFSQLGHLTRHRSQHTTDHSFRCTTCPAAFGNAYHLKVHMQRHNTENTFKCKCGSAFSRASILTEHMRIHTGERPFKCNQCPAAFARSANLAAHRRKHTGERPYVCQHCQQGFTQSTSLNRHLQSKKACLARRGLPRLAAASSGSEGDSTTGDTGGGQGRGRCTQRDQTELNMSSAGFEGDSMGEFFPEGVSNTEHQERRNMTTNKVIADENNFLSSSSLTDRVDSSALPSSQIHSFDNGAGVPISGSADGAATDAKDVSVTSIFNVSGSQEGSVSRAPMESSQQFVFSGSGEKASLERSVADNVSENDLFPDGALPSSITLPLQGGSSNTATNMTDNSIFSSRDLSAGAAHPPQGESAARSQNSGHLHTVTSLSGVGNSMMPLPPITMVTDFRGGMSSASDSLMALRTMGHSSTYYHPQMTSPSRSHLPPTHVQLHHQ